MKPIVIHPGEILLEDFMRPLGLNCNVLALAIRVPSNRVLAITKSKRAITADTALRLARYFGTTPDFWINLQGLHDLKKAAFDCGARIRREIQPHAA